MHIKSLCFSASVGILEKLGITLFYSTFPSVFFKESIY